jgi:hypothetical protein
MRVGLGSLLVSCYGKLVVPNRSETMPKKLLLSCCVLLLVGSAVLADEGVFDNAEVARLKQVRSAKSQKSVKPSASVGVELAVLKRCLEREQLETYIVKTALPANRGVMLSNELEPSCVQGQDSKFEQF